MEIQHPRCPFCHTGVQPDHDKAACDRCMSWHHSGCWSEHGACATCRSRVRLGRVEDHSPSLTDVEPLIALSAPLPARRPAALGARGLCPRCGLSLAAQLYEGQDVHACGGCAGSWLTPVACAEIAVKREVRFSDFERQAALAQIYGPSRRGIERGLACPDCGERLGPRSFQSLIAYRCAHGVWLDPGDLARIQILVEVDPESLQMLLDELGFTPRRRFPGGPWTV